MNYSWSLKRLQIWATYQNVIWVKRNSAFRRWILFDEPILIFPRRIQYTCTRTGRNASGKDFWLYLRYAWTDFVHFFVFINPSSIF
jgi:hypothetical protein